MGIVVSNFILFQEYIDAFLLGFVVSQIFRDSKKRVKKVTQIISDKIIYLSDTFQNSSEPSYCFSCVYCNILYILLVETMLVGGEGGVAEICAVG